VAAIRGSDKVFLKRFIETGETWTEEIRKKITAVAHAKAHVSEKTSPA